MGGSQHKAKVKSLWHDMYLTENAEGVPEMKKHTQGSYFGIEYQVGAKISIKSINNGYLGIQHDGSLRFSDENKQEFFQVCGYN